MTLASLASQGSRSLHTGSGSPDESSGSPAGDGAVAPGASSSAVEHALHTGGVGGSTPSSRTISKERRRLPTRYVYFVQAKRLRFIKIGVTNDVRARFAALQTASPDKLILLGAMYVDGAHLLEKHLHGTFWDARAHHEWYHPRADLSDYIKARAVSIDLIDLGSQLAAAMNYAATGSMSLASRGL